MIVFTEKLVEACVATSPSAFLPFKASLDRRQQKLGGFIPDLILASDDGPVVLEIQLHALDRGHLYRLLEYRDLYEDAYGIRPRVILMSEIVPDRYKPLLRTHGIETITFVRADFIRLALENCPAQLLPHVLADATVEEADDFDEEAPPAPGGEFEPLKWSQTTSAAEVERFFDRQISALGMNRYDLPRPYQGTIYQSLKSFYREPTLQAVSNLYRPKDWNWKNLISSHDDIRQRTLRKPRIGIGCYITQKGNFSAFFYDPNKSGSRDDGDWWIPPRSSSYGWERPDDEILFVRDAVHLDPRPDRKRFHYEKDWSGLDSILVGWLKATYNDIIDAARLIYDVEVQSDIFLDLESLGQKSGWRAHESIVGWHISNSSEELKKAAEFWLLALRDTHKIDIDHFMKVYGESLRPNDPALAPKSVVIALTAAGAQMEAKDVRYTLNQLRLVEPDDYARIRPQDLINPHPSSAPR